MSSLKFKSKIKLFDNIKIPRLCPMQCTFVGSIFASFINKPNFCPAISTFSTAVK